MHLSPDEGTSLTEPAGVSAYDDIAEGYSAENETSLLNAYYERPAVLGLAAT